MKGSGTSFTSTWRFSINNAPLHFHSSLEHFLISLSPDLSTPWADPSSQKRLASLLQSRTTANPPWPLFRRAKTLHTRTVSDPFFVLWCIARSHAFIAHTDQPPKYRDRPFDLEQPFVDSVHEEFLHPRASSSRSHSSANNRGSSSSNTTGPPGAPVPDVSPWFEDTPPSAETRGWSQGDEDEAMVLYRLEVLGEAVPLDDILVPPPTRRLQYDRARDMLGLSPRAPVARMPPTTDGLRGDLEEEEDDEALEVVVTPSSAAFDRHTLPLPLSVTRTTTTQRTSSSWQEEDEQQRNIAPSSPVLSFRGPARHAPHSTAAAPRQLSSSAASNTPSESERRSMLERDVIDTLQEEYELERADAEALYNRLVTVHVRLHGSSSPSFSEDGSGSGRLGLGPLSSRRPGAPSLSLPSPPSSLSVPGTAEEQAPPPRRRPGRTLPTAEQAVEDAERIAAGMRDIRDALRALVDSRPPRGADTQTPAVPPLRARADYAELPSGGEGEESV
jgi:hypothetical protein